MDPWTQAFGTDLNLGVNSASVDAGNGAFNSIDGDVTAVATQNVGDTGFGFGGYGSPLGGDMNLGFNSAHVEAGNGAFNSIGGDVTAVATQNVGDTGFLAIF